MKASIKYDSFVVCDGDSVYASFVRYNRLSNKFYVEGNDGRTSWEIGVTPEQLRAIADFIEEFKKNNK